MVRKVLTDTCWKKIEYRHHNLIEHFFNRIKHWRRIATLYDKPARSYLSFVQLACALKSFV